MPVATPVEATVQVAPAAPAVDASSEGAAAPASKKARQYDLSPQQPLEPMPHLQPALPTSSTSPAALPEPTTTSSPTEPEAKKHKQQHEEDDEDLAMDSFHPLQPTDPPVLPLSEHQPAAAADLEASRSRSRTHSEVSDTPTINYPDPAPDPKHQSGNEEATLPEPSLPPPDPPSLTSSVEPTEFYSDIAKAHGRVHVQLDQDFMLWKNMGKHNLVLWLDYTEEATTYHTLDMSMWGAVRYRRTFSYDDCNMVQSIAIDHKYSPSTYRTKMPIHSGKGFFTEFWYDPQALDIAHWLCDTFADFIAPVSFVLLSYYMDEMALNATRKNRARKEATVKELKVCARMFIEAKSAEIKSWFDNDVFDLVDIRKFKPKNFVTGSWVLTVKRDRDGKFQKCKARWVLRGFQDRQKDAQQTDSPTSTRDQACDFFAKMQPPMVGPSDTLTSTLRSFRGKVMHQIAMWSVNCLQKQGSRGTWQHG